MNNSLKIHTVRVFIDEKGNFGNPVGIILDEKNNLNKSERQKIAAQLNFSESVFINDLKSGNVTIFNPKKEVLFAGHAMVGTAWLINKLTGRQIDSLICAGGLVKTWIDNECTWIRANLDIMPQWQYEQLKNPSDVERLTIQETSSKKHTFVWAWINETKGLIRARTIAPDWGIPEDEANGSGSMKLAATLGRKLEIRHGKGSVIYVKPNESDSVDLGGRVVENN